MSRSVSESILRSLTAVAVVTVLAKLVGYVEKRVLAYFYGTQDELEAYFVALRISLFAFSFVAGVLAPIALPLLTTAKNQSVAAARNFGYSLAAVFVLVFSGVAIGGGLFSAELAGLFAKGFSADKQRLCAEITQWLLPCVMVVALTSLLRLSLRVQRRFALATFGQCLQKGLFVVCILIWGASLDFRWIVAAFWVSMLSVFFLFSGVHLWRFPMFRRFEFVGKQIGHAALLSIPLLAGGFVSQFGRMLQTRIASTLESGSIAALTYAQAAIDLPLLLVPVSLSYVMLVYFSDFSDRSDLTRSFRYLSRSLRYLFLIFCPAAVFTVCLHNELASVLFAGGAFTSKSVALTGTALTGLGPGLPLFAAEMILMSFFYAHKRIAIPVVCGLAATGTAIVALPALTHEFGLTGVSAYLTVARLCKVSLLICCLRLLGISFPRGRALAFAGKMAVALLATWGAYIVLERGLATHSSLSQLSVFSKLVAHLTASGVVYLVSVWLLRFPECSEFMALLRRYTGIIVKRLAK